MTLEEQLIGMLRKKQFHISTAESCTGGMIASCLVGVSGASDVFEEGYITYSNRVKEKLLLVRHQTIQQYTAVSAETAKEMAEGVHRATDSELTLSVTGYAGPDDGEDGTKAGTVYIGTWFDGKAEAKKYLFCGERNEVRLQAAKEAIRIAIERMQRIE